MFRITHKYLEGEPDGTGGAPAGGDTPPQQQPPSGADQLAGGGETNWLDSFGEDAKGFVEMRGWKEPDQIIESFKNLESKMGVPADRLLKLPEKADDAEGWKQVYSKLGMPDTPEGYKLPVPDGDDGKFAEQASKWMHEAGIPAPMAQKLAEQWNEYAAEQTQAFETQQAQESEAQMNALKAEWGDAYQANIEMGRRAARGLGVDQESLAKIEDALGTGEMLKLFSRIGGKLGEDSFEGGDGGGNFGMSPDAAKAKIASLKADKEWAKKYMNGDASAVAEFERLHKIAHPGSIQS